MAKLLSPQAAERLAATEESRLLDFSQGYLNGADAEQGEEPGPYQPSSYLLGWQAALEDKFGRVEVSPPPCLGPPPSLSTFTVGDWTGAVEVKAQDAFSAFEQVFDVSPTEVKMSSDLDYEDDFDSPVSDLDWSKDWLTLTFVSHSPTSDALVVEVVKVEKEEPQKIIQKDEQFDVCHILEPVWSGDPVSYSIQIEHLKRHLTEEGIFCSGGISTHLQTDLYQRGYKAGREGGFAPDWMNASSEFVLGFEHGQNEKQRVIDQKAREEALAEYQASVLEDAMAEVAVGEGQSDPLSTQYQRNLDYIAKAKAEVESGEKDTHHLQTACWCSQDVDGIPCLVPGHDDDGVSALLSEIDDDERVLRQYGPSPLDDFKQYLLKELDVEVLPEQVEKEADAVYLAGYEIGASDRNRFQREDVFGSDWPALKAEGYHQGWMDTDKVIKQVALMTAEGQKGGFHAPEWH